MGNLQPFAFRGLAFVVFSLFSSIVASCFNSIVELVFTILSLPPPASSSTVLAKALLVP
jgi:uncharacterized protein YdaL